MKILILGVKGNLGGQLKKIFSNNKENEVIGFDKEEIDITDQKLLSEKIIKLKPEIIINAVAYNAVDKCEADPLEFELAKKINAEAVGYLAKIAQKINAILIHYSTDYVFNGENPAGYDEEATPNPINNYGLSKYLGEQEMLKNIDPSSRFSGTRDDRDKKDTKYYLIRTSKLFGPKGESELAKPSFFDIMLKLAREKEKIEVVDEEKSCFTYTPDLAEATKKLIDEQKPFGIYHITNSEPATWYEACVKLFEIAGIKTKVIPITSEKLARPAMRPKSSILLNKKLRPLRSYAEALKEYLQK